MRKFLLALLIFPLCASAQEGGGIGYPTVAAALEALKARSDVVISVQGDWTIAEDQADHAIWSFTPPDHAAHPAVVRRVVVEHDGQVGLDMRALCQAGKAACDQLMEDFKALNAHMAESISGKTADAGAWQPSGAQDDRVGTMTRRYFASKDEGRYQEAYAMLTPSQQQQMPFARWSFRSQYFNASAGQVVRRDIRKITWYRNPPQAAPGVYAAVDFYSEFSNLRLHCGYLVWAQQGDGSFLLLREEENMVDKVTAAQLPPGQLDALRAQFKCK